MQQQEAAREFEQQIREHERLLYKVCHIYADHAADRDDLFQEIVIQLWKAYPNFKGKSTFSTWLYRVALNTAITGLRKKKNFITTYEPAQLPEHPDDQQAQVTEERLQLMYSAISELNSIDKAIVMLYMEDRSYEEMEDILGMSQGSLRVRMNRIKATLRERTKNF